jgi:hypothetical protein
VADPEACASCRARRTLLWTSEGDGRLGLDPFLHEIDLDGRHLRAFSLPTHLRMRATTTPARATTSPWKAWPSRPTALASGWPWKPPSSRTARSPLPWAPGGPCRFTLLDMDSGRAAAPVRLHARCNPRAPLVPGTYADNGVSEILMVDNHRMLVLERAYMTGVGNSLRLYQVDTRDGSNTLDQPQLLPGRQPADAQDAGGRLARSWA